MQQHQIAVFLKWLGDIGAGSVAVLTWLFNAMPQVAASLSALWFLWRFYDRIKYGPAARRADD